MTEEARDQRRTLTRALRDRKGGVMIMTAVMLPLLLLVVGFAADYGYASYVNQGLGRAADMAAVSAVSAGAAQTVGGYSNTSMLQYVGTQAFAENAKQMNVPSATSNVSVTSDGNGGVTAVVTYSYQVPSFFGGVTGRSATPVSGTVRAAAKPPTYVNYYILIDTSQSMGIGTTQADMNTLYARVATYGYGSNGEVGCQFGCHVAATGRAFTNEQLAHNFTPKVTLRIDSAVQAVQSMISTAQQVIGSTGNVRIGLYTIQKNPMDGTNIKIVATPSNNFGNLQSAAATIDLGSNDGNAGFGDTDYVNELSTFNGMLPAQGSGATAASPLNFVFIITDGVQDTPMTYTPFDNGKHCNSNYGHCTWSMDYTQCTPLKAKATVATIYTTYQPIMKNANPTQYEDTYKDLVLPFASQIGPAVQACATSTDLALEAQYGSDIVAAVQALFNKTLPQAARLNQ